MEPLDRELARALEDSPLPSGPARLLLVGIPFAGGSPLLPALRRRRHHCTEVSRLGEARAALARRRYDVVLVQATLPDGRGIELLPMVQKTAPSTKAILLADQPELLSVIEAVRGGAIDFIDSAGCDEETALQRLDAAIIRSRVDQQREDRLLRLKRICRELNHARREVSAQVDLLCNDLAAAYQDIGTQMSDVEMATEFRTLVRQELDVEELLRTTLEYMLTKTGATNAAVFLSDHDRNFGLGAYVNYDCPRDTVSVLLDHLCQAICPQMLEEQEIVCFDDADEFAQWVGIEGGFLEGSQVIAWSCMHQGQCLAVVVLFRSREEPFDEKLAGVIDVLRPIFARQLATVIAVHHRANAPWPEEPCEDETDDYGFGVAA